MRFIKIIWLIAVPLLVSTFSYAGTSLPYMGPDSLGCKVEIPKDKHSVEVDGGYLSSEDCHIIYIKPPRQGVIKHTEMRKTQLAGFCSLTNSLIEEANVIFKAKVDSEKKNITYKELISATDSEETSAELAKKMQASVKELILSVKLLKYFKKGIKDISDNDVVATYSADVSLEWAKLVSAYSKANPTHSVQPLPISVGLISATVKTNPRLTSPVDHKNLFQTIEVNPVVESRVNGLNLSDIRSTTDLPFPDFVSSYIGSATLMGQNASIQLGLSALGFCANQEARRNSTDPDGQLGGTVKAYMAPTYTYFYPIQTKATYKVILNKDKVKDTIKRLFIAGGKIALTAASAEKNFPDTTVKISMNPGAFGSEQGKELRDQYEASLKKMVLDEILARASIQIEGLYQSALDTINTTHNSRQCRRGRWPWSSTVCHTRSYTVSVKKLNSKRFDRYLTDIVAVGASGQVDSYINHTLFDTSTFVVSPAQLGEI